jgi:hypothetical protein
MVTERECERTSPEKELEGGMRSSLRLVAEGEA